MGTTPSPALWLLQRIANALPGVAIAAAGAGVAASASAQSPSDSLPTQVIPGPQTPDGPPSPPPPVPPQNSQRPIPDESTIDVEALVLESSDVLTEARLNGVWCGSVNEAALVPDGRELPESGLPHNAPERVVLAVPLPPWRNWSTTYLPATSAAMTARHGQPIACYWWQTWAGNPRPHGRALLDADQHALRAPVVASRAWHLGAGSDE